MKEILKEMTLKERVYCITIFYSSSYKPTLDQYPFKLLIKKYF